MKFAVFYHDLLPYHVARYRALAEEAEREQARLFLYAITSISKEWQREGRHGDLGGRARVLLPATSASQHGSWAKCRALVNALEHDSPDVVGIVGYAERYSQAALAWCGWRRRAALVMHVGTLWDRPRTAWKEWIKRRLVKRFDAGICGGGPQADYLVHLGLPRPRILTGYNVVDNAFFGRLADEARTDRARWGDELGLPRPFLLSASRLAPEKNIAGLLDGYAHYRREAGDAAWDLAIAGSGSESDALRGRCRTLGVGDRVHWLGFQGPEELARLYGLAEAFVLASWREPWGLVVNEAMAAGLPVVVSERCGCARDLVIDGITGFPFDPADRRALADLMARLSSDRPARARMGSQARAHIARFGVEQFATQMFKAARMAMAHRLSPSAASGT